MKKTKKILKKKITVQEKDWATSKYRTREWEQSVKIITWEHDYEKKQYVIIYNEKTEKINRPELEGEKKSAQEK